MEKEWELRTFRDETRKFTLTINNNTRASRVSKLIHFNTKFLKKFTELKEVLLNTFNMIFISYNYMIPDNCIVQSPRQN